MDLDADLVKFYSDFLGKLVVIHLKSGGFVKGELVAINNRFFKIVNLEGKPRVRETDDIKSMDLDKKVQDGR